MQLADKFVHPTKFTGEYPSGWGGYTYLDYDPRAGSYHPGDDYNYGSGSDDLGQDVVACANGQVIYAEPSTKGYGTLGIIKHSIGYNLKRFVKETYGIEADALYSLSGHLQSISVKAGDEVKAGDVIGKVGKSGTEFPHLHFELYHLGKDLANVSYRFYPIGWDKEKIKANWLPAYKFIEATKQIEAFETFLGKSKDYWLTVEKDRENLIKQLGEKDAEFSKILTPIAEQVKTLEKQNQQLSDTIAKHPEVVENAVKSIKNDLEKCELKLTTAEGTIKDHQNKIVSLLAGGEKQLEVKTAIDLLAASIKKYFKV